MTGQTHCHQHAVLGDAADRRLREAAGLTGELTGGCCGLAGNFGFEKGHYDISTACAEDQLLPAVRASTADTIVLADGFSCRTQLEQLGGVRGRHVAEVLAEGLGEAPGDVLGKGPGGGPGAGRGEMRSGGGGARTGGAGVVVRLVVLQEQPDRRPAPGAQHPDSPRNPV